MTSLYGNPIPIQILVVNSAGVPTDPATLTLTVYRPDSGSDVYQIGALTRTGAGAYTYPYNSAAPGTHPWTAVATVPAFSTEGSFTVEAFNGALVGTRLSSGYLTVAEFRNMATYLEFDNLVQGGSQGQNSEELANELRRASAWADDYIGRGPDGPQIGAMITTEQHRCHVDRDGLINIRPYATSGGVPVRQLISLAYGTAPTLLTTLADLSGLWQDAATLSIPIGNYTGSWSGPLQFNTASPGRDLFVRISYVSGWPSTVLTSDATAGGTTLIVADPTGIRAGDQLTVIDPGDPASADTSSEQVTVLSVAANTVTITGTLLSSHTASQQIGISGVPDNLKKAIAFVARSFLGRRGPEKSKSSFAGSRLSTSTKTIEDAVIASDQFLTNAAAILEPYRRKTP